MIQPNKIHTCLLTVVNTLTIKNTHEIYITLKDLI